MFLTNLDNILLLSIFLLKVLALSNAQCKPILEVVDEYEAGDITENEALLDVPLRG